MVPLLWRRSLDARKQYYRLQGSFEGWLQGTWRPADAASRACPPDNADFKNAFGDGCEAYLEGGPGHEYCLSDRQRAYIYCPRACEVFCSVGAGGDGGSEL